MQTLQDKLKAERGNARVEILKGLGAGHGGQGLGTFSRGKKGMEGRIFSRRDLESVATLASYSRTSGNYNELRAALSLLVCMICESARIPMMESDFTNMYYGGKVVADEAIRSYDDAKDLLNLRQAVFAEYPRALAVEKLEKRADELSKLVTAIEAAMNTGNRQELLKSLLSARPMDADSPVVEFVKRFRHMCKELNFQTRVRLRSSSARRPIRAHCAPPG